MRRILALTVALGAVGLGCQPVEDDTEPLPPSVVTLEAQYQAHPAPYVEPAPAPAVGPVEPGAKAPCTPGTVYVIDGDETPCDLIGGANTLTVIGMPMGECHDSGGLWYSGECEGVDF